MDDRLKINVLNEALEQGEGVLRLAPAWVPRDFLPPGGRLKLDPRDIYALGVDRGGICERWLASTTNADNGPGTPVDEGLSYIVIQERTKVRKILLREAIELMGDRFLGEDVMRRYGRWMVLCKFFDYKDPIFLHLHQSDEDAAKVGRLGKPEAYYFPSQLNVIEGSFPYTFFGLKSGTTREDIIRCLERWNQGDNDILYYSRAYKLKPGTGWNVPPGILHAPGTLVTYESQRASDVSAAFQSMVQGRPISRDLLVKDVPKEHHDDLDCIVDMLDWEDNLDPEFAKNHYVEPLPVQPLEEMQKRGYIEYWIAYNSPYFSAKELRVLPGKTVISQDSAAYGLVVVQGRGKMQNMQVESPTLIRFGELTNDEFFVTKEAAGKMKITNLSTCESLVILKHFGPGNPDFPQI
ncbi:hypothetical protein HQ584_10700 [Patescibacteria group bacterium]|nr:hypothetical protein [Patescibacteria group bacterium]